MMNVWVSVHAYFISMSNNLAAVCAPHRLLDGVQQRMAQNLSYILDPLGIRVCSVAVGPLEVRSKDGNSFAPSPSITK